MKHCEMFFFGWRAGDFRVALRRGKSDERNDGRGGYRWMYGGGLYGTACDAKRDDSRVEK